MVCSDRGGFIKHVCMVCVNGCGIQGLQGRIFRSVCENVYARACQGRFVFLLSSLAPGRDEGLSLQHFQLFLGPTHSSIGTQAEATLVYIPRARGHHHQQFKRLSPKQQNSVSISHRGALPECMPTRGPSRTHHSKYTFIL